MDSDLIELSSSLSETNIFGGGLECLTCPAARYYFPAHTLTWFGNFNFIRLLPTTSDD